MAEDNPGAQLFLNIGDHIRYPERPRPAAPEDLFVFRGHWGQFIFLIPSLDLIIVRVRGDRDGSFSINEFLGKKNEGPGRYGS